MNIHEYQAKELLKKYNVAVPAGIAAMSVEEAVAASKQLPGPLYVVKAQIHAGGRGAGKFKNSPEGKGGVRLCKTPDEVKAAAEAMMNQVLVHPAQYQSAHLRQFFMCAVEQINSTVFGLAKFLIKRPQVVTHTFDARRRRKQVFSPI